MLGSNALALSNCTKDSGIFLKDKQQRSCSARPSYALEWPSGLRLHLSQNLSEKKEMPLSMQPPQIIAARWDRIGGN